MDSGRMLSAPRDNSAGVDRCLPPRYQAALVASDCDCDQLS